MNWANRLTIFRIILVPVFITAIFYNKLINIPKNYLVLCLGAHLTILSTLIIISAASLADNKACSLTLKHSYIEK